MTEGKTVSQERVVLDPRIKVAHLVQHVRIKTSLSVSDRVQNIFPVSPNKQPSQHLFS